MSLHSPRETGPTRPGLPVTGQRRRLALSGVRGQVARGRDFTRQALVDWGWLDESDPYGQSTADDVLLVVSELLANACLHAGGPHELVLHASDRLLRIEVLDGHPGLPVLKSPHDPGRPGGHGLHIVQKLSDRWGTTPGGDGKSVWLEFAAERLSAEAWTPQDDEDEDLELYAAYGHALGAEERDDHGGAENAVPPMRRTEESPAT